jgi:hypothetical protein
MYKQTATSNEESVTRNLIIGYSPIFKYGG